ncbi:hypothetical protein AK812_SmicGene33021 [Symbiodinium microadriaticum]|uniref:Uncharacterized protein n=2 Tax=Symbiodinium TaxID=2949 RepID=A0A1Q9CSN9_SYMMI|nr:hypothetical protein AK812_SmicGene33021 [Symbiodinium microadriaticum]
MRTGSCSPCGTLRPTSPVEEGRRLQGSGPCSAASPSSRTAACNEAQQLRGEVLELRALLQRSKAAHVEEASRLHLQMQDLEAALRHEHGLREDAERGERVANSERDELRHDLDILQHQLQVLRSGIPGADPSEGRSSPRRRRPGDDLRALGNEILQVRQDSQDLRGQLLTRQHEAELRRLRGDLAETERAARAAQASLRHAEDSHELQLSTETATMRRLEQRCRFLEHGAEAAEAELTTTSQQLVALEVK